MKAVIVADVYCPHGCGAAMTNLLDKVHCVCKSSHCKGFEILYLRPTVELKPDRLANVSPKSEAKT